jgi:hypothetical protein
LLRWCERRSYELAVAAWRERQNWKPDNHTAQLVVYAIAFIVGAVFIGTGLVMASIALIRIL